MRGLSSAAGYVPYHRLRREAIPTSIGGSPSRGSRSVAGHDEDATTMAVAAARLALAGNVPVPDVLTFSTASPAYLDKTNATAVHAALRLPSSTRATDAGGAPRSTIGALLGALEGRGNVLVTSADMRTGLPGGPDERECGDAAAAVMVIEDDGELLARHLASASATAEFLDRYRPPTAATTTRWEERFGETQYVPLAQEAFDAACKQAGITIEDVDHLIVTGLHARATKRAAKAIAGTRDILVDDLTGSIGNSGSPHPLVLLTDVLERATTGQRIVVLSIADGADAIVFEATGGGIRASPSVASQIAAGDDRLDYLRFLSWRGHLDPEPPRRPSPARASAPASARNSDWKFGFTGSRNNASGSLHLPPARVAWDTGIADDMSPAPMADVPATIRTFTVDHLSWTPSPPIVFAVLDFDATEDGPGGRYACALTDVDPERVAIGDRVQLTFRRLGEADGVVNYFWKARPLRADADATTGEG